MLTAGVWLAGSADLLTAGVWLAGSADLRSDFRYARSRKSRLLEQRGRARKPSGVAGCVRARCVFARAVRRRSVGGPSEVRRRVRTCLMSERSFGWDAML
eukprot:8412127-Pyramimonas_sp.AAC.1